MRNTRKTSPRDEVANRNEKFMAVDSRESPDKVSRKHGRSFAISSVTSRCIIVRPPKVSRFKSPPESLNEWCSAYLLRPQELIQFQKSCCDDCNENHNVSICPNQLSSRLDSQEDVKGGTVFQVQ